MKILITGANGMLGSSLCQIYHKEHKVYAFHRDKESFLPCMKDYSLDLTDSTQLQLCFDQIMPDLVIHCAGMTSVDVCEKEPTLAYEANVTVTENIARICSNETKLVYISTDQVYGSAKDRSEINKKLLPINQYGKTKLLGEQKIQKLFSNHVIIRTNIFGWNEKTEKVSSVEWMYNSMRKGKKITLFTDYIFSPIYTESLGFIIMQLVDMDFTGVINVGSPSHCSKYVFGQKLAGEFGVDKSCILKGSIDDYNFAAPRCKNLSLNVNKLSYIGLTAPDYGESIKKLNQNKPH